jgi:AcrR family transcriptional regulator
MRWTVVVGWPFQTAALQCNVSGNAVTVPADAAQLASLAYCDIQGSPYPWTRRAPESMNLMERRWQRTRLDIELAAVELFERYGFTAVTVDQIADAAGVSVRTFYRYCSSKEDSLTSHLPIGARDLAAAVERAVDVPFLQAVREASLALMANGDIPVATLRRVIALCLVESHLHARWMSGAREAQDRLATVITRRHSDADPERALVLAGAIVAALGAAYEGWAREGGDMSGHVTHCIAVLEPLFPVGQLPG